MAFGNILSEATRGHHGINRNLGRKPVDTVSLPVLQVCDAETGYGDATVLRGVDLDLRAGEIVVLMGRNGSGKTTLLKSIVGLVRLKRGQVFVDGESMTGRSVADICLRIGYLPQDPNALLFADTVEDELKITLRNHEMAGRQAKTPDGIAHHPGGDSALISDLLRRLDLVDKAHAYPRDLSGGERQRVALAAVTVTQPRVLLLDEPTRGLDYAAKESLATLLRQWRDGGKAILVVTHDVEMAALIADRVMVMSQGEIIADGDPRLVMSNSPLFAPQIARVFPGQGWLTVDDALAGLGRPVAHPGTAAHR